MKPHRQNRNRAYYRHHRNRVINRKRSIIKYMHWNVPYYQYGRLSKGKIHCSCKYCSNKTYTLGFPHSQKARLEAWKEFL